MVQEGSNREEENAETQEYGEQQEGNCLRTQQYNGFLSLEVNQQEVAENMRGNKHMKRVWNKQEDDEYPGVSTQKKAKLKAEEMWKQKWDRIHQDKEATDLKRSIQKEQNSIDKGEQKGEHKDDGVDSQAKIIRLTDIGSVREEAQKINNRCVGGQKGKEENKDSNESEKLEIDNVQLDIIECDEELTNEDMNSQMDKQEKAKQARVMLMNRMKNIRVQKGLDKAKNKQIKKKQVAKGNSTGRTNEHIDMSAGYKCAERGARQATLDRWVARPINRVDRWKPD
jgi:hypothetical protein